MKSKVINKGYTLEVVSWENDGDNYKTKFKTVDSIEEASKLVKICNEVFTSCNNGDGGVGNSMDGESNHVLLEYVEENKKLFPGLVEEDAILNYFRDVSYGLMGGSECYDFRICESVKVTYSPEDIYLEVIEL